MTDQPKKGEMNMRRCNIEKTEYGIRLCMGEHEKSAECDWQYFVGAAIALTAEAERDALKAEVERLRKSENEWKQKWISRT